MLDIIESTRTLTDTGLKPDQAAAIRARRATGR